jgi:hypothetical protein
MKRVDKISMIEYVELNGIRFNTPSYAKLNNVELRNISTKHCYRSTFHNSERSISTSYKPASVITLNT